ncbi:hypothetical protein QE152_g9475 [Popillia japonica]|uniref:Uncharacterized protein n=1 Tax=Popillia japonica TaxID=7064 RepID=A0AAW1M0P1_POPJA
MSKGPGRKVHFVADGMRNAIIDRGIFGSSRTVNFNDAKNKIGTPNGNAAHSLPRSNAARPRSSGGIEAISGPTSLSRVGPPSHGLILVVIAIASRTVCK